MCKPATRNRRRVGGSWPSLHTTHLPCPVLPPDVTLPDPLPMFTRPTHPDAHHAVTAPGGYEWWYFDAESADGRDRMVAILFEGFVFHAGYLRAHKRFLKRPTKVKPPTGNDFPAAYLCHYRDGKIHRQFMTQVRADAFEASADKPRVRVGDCALTPTQEGLRLQMTGTPWHLTARGPQLLAEETLTCDLTFCPASRSDSRPEERIFLSRTMTGQHHGWIPAAPRCDVSGTIGQASFTGRGYHDHNFGTGPLGDGLRRWVWGRVLTRDATVAFHVAEPRDKTLPTEKHLFRVDDSGFADLPADDVAVDWSRRTGTGLTYPTTVTAGSLSLTQPTIIDASPFYLRATYKATIDGRGAPDSFCEIGHPHRLRWPILGRMIEMSIDKRSLKS